MSDFPAEFNPVTKRSPEEIAKALADVEKYRPLMYPVGEDRAALCQAAIVLADARNEPEPVGEVFSQENLFNEDALGREIARRWGEHGAHSEVYRMLRQALQVARQTIEVKQPGFDMHYHALFRKEAAARKAADLRVKALDAAIAEMKKEMGSDKTVVDLFVDEEEKRLEAQAIINQVSVLVARWSSSTPEIGKELIRLCGGKAPETLPASLAYLELAVMATTAPLKDLSDAVGMGKLAHEQLAEKDKQIEAFEKLFADKKNVETQIDDFLVERIRKLEAVVIRIREAVVRERPIFFTHEGLKTSDATIAIRAQLRREILADIDAAPAALTGAVLEKAAVIEAAIAENDCACVESACPHQQALWSATEKLVAARAAVSAEESMVSARAEAARLDSPDRFSPPGDPGPAVGAIAPDPKFLSASTNPRDCNGVPGHDGYLSCPVHKPKHDHVSVGCSGAKEVERVIRIVYYPPSDPQGRRHTSWLKWASAGSPPEDFGKVERAQLMPADHPLSSDGDAAPIDHAPVGEADLAREVVEAAVAYEKEFAGEAFRKSPQGNRLVRAIAAMAIPAFKKL